MLKPTNKCKKCDNFIPPNTFPIMKAEGECALGLSFNAKCPRYLREKVRDDGSTFADFVFTVCSNRKKEPKITSFF